MSVNGATLFNGQVQQDAQTLLDYAAGERDRAQLYTAELILSVPD